MVRSLNTRDTDDPVTFFVTISLFTSVGKAPRIMPAALAFTLPYLPPSNLESFGSANVNFSIGVAVTHFL